MVKWCAMHVINLGVALWSCGSTFRLLLDSYPSVWPGQTDNDRLAFSYELFRKWTKERKIQNLV